MQKSHRVVEQQDGKRGMKLAKRLRLHGIIKKIGKTYKYYVTELGRHLAVAGLTLKTMFLVPEFAATALAD